MLSTLLKSLFQVRRELVALRSPSAFPAAARAGHQEVTLKTYKTC
jgi:hypothetical protein